MKRIIFLIPSTLALFAMPAYALNISNNETDPPPAFIGVYALNQDSNLLNKLSSTYGVKNINGGFLFLKKNSSCSFDNLTDGSGIHPITGHENEYQNFVNDGGKLGFTISGADHGETNVLDPIRRCSRSDLETLMLDIINRSPVEVSFLSVDIESDSNEGAWQDGAFNKDSYDKIGLSLEKVKSIHPNIKTDLIFPEYSDYWAPGYNQSFKDFFITYSSSIDSISIMTPATDANTLKYGLNYSLNAIGNWPRNKSFYLFYEGNAGAKFTADELKEVTLDLGFAGLTTLVTDAENLSKVNAQLYKNTYGHDFGPTGLTKHKIDFNKTKEYSNTYVSDSEKPKVTAYLSNWSHYSQGYEPNIDELAKYDTVLLSFLGLCGTKVGDPGVTGGVEGLEKSCAKYGLDKFELSMTDDYADIEKQFPDMGMTFNPDLTWLSPKPNGLLGVMKKLHEDKGTRVGISIFGWSLSNIASDAVKPENRSIFLNSLVNFVKAYPFIGQLDIDWEYPGIQGASENVFDPVNDARNYREFIAELRLALDNINRNDITIGIASGAPNDKIDAAELKSLVEAGVDNIHLMTYDFSGQWDDTLNHHTNLLTPHGSVWSADRAIQYMIKDLGIPSKNIQLGYANYSRNAIVSELHSLSPLMGNFTPQANTVGTFEATVTTVNDLFTNYVNVDQNSKMTGINGFKLYTDKAANADYLYNEKTKLFMSIDTPRTVYSKAKYVLKYNLGGIFTWMADHDEGLMLNSAREGLGYQPAKQVFDMHKTINTCGVNVPLEKECTNITNQIDIDAVIEAEDKSSVLVIGENYHLEAKVYGLTDLIHNSGWRLRKVSGTSKENITLSNLDNGSAIFQLVDVEENSEMIKLWFIYTITAIGTEKPITLNKTIMYTLSGK
ncbi:glycosyl hydrolase family 18 protein [Aliivibrio wodanis]|uniref:glycosyl hydrolase family 18 protein n=1 Tax=Aliivibrio wodanis TaxID=80852 RepID=UPI00406D4310